MSNKENFETKLNKLNDIVKNMERSDLKINDAISSFKTGKIIIKELNDELESMEKEVVKIINEGE